MNTSALRFGDRVVTCGAPCYVIAEIGINHEGSVENCARLIEESARAGADAVKLQTIDAASNYAPGTVSHQLFSEAALTPEETAAMFKLARDRGVEVFTTAGDFQTLEWVDRLAPVAHKISSGLLTSLPIVRAAAATGRPLVMSTGMSGVDAIKEALEAARNSGIGGVGLLQCTSLYPAPDDTLNLRSIPFLAERFHVPIGLSDHSVGIAAASLAVAAGATMIEKHFSLDPTQPGFDHPISLDPKSFKDMIAAIREAERMLGVYDKPLSEDAAANARRYLRSLAARHDLPSGHVLTADDVGIMRLDPNNRGLAPSAYDSVIGRRLNAPRNAYEPIREEHLT